MPARFAAHRHEPCYGKPGGLNAYSKWPDSRDFASPRQRSHPQTERRAVIGGPAPDDGVESYEHRLGVGPAQGPHLGAQPFPDPSPGRLAWLDQQLAAIPADVEPQEIKALFEGDDTRLVLVKDQTPGRPPAGEPCLNLKRLVL